MLNFFIYCFINLAFKIHLLGSEMYSNLFLILLVIPFFALPPPIRGNVSLEMSPA